MSGNLTPKVGKSRRIKQAKYNDTCSECLQDINQGDNIEMTAEGVIHFGCARKDDDGEEEG